MAPVGAHVQARLGRSLVQANVNLLSDVAGTVLDSMRRTPCRVDKITEYLCDPLQRCLKVRQQLSCLAATSGWSSCCTQHSKNS